MCIRDSGYPPGREWRAATAGIASLDRPRRGMVGTVLRHIFSEALPNPARISGLGVKLRRRVLCAELAPLNIIRGWNDASFTQRTGPCLLYTSPSPRDS